MYLLSKHIPFPLESTEKNFLLSGNITKLLYTTTIDSLSLVDY